MGTVIHMKFPDDSRLCQVDRKKKPTKTKPKKKQAHFDHRQAISGPGVFEFVETASHFLIKAVFKLMAILLSLFPGSLVHRCEPPHPEQWSF